MKIFFCNQFFTRIFSYLLRLRQRSCSLLAIAFCCLQPFSQKSIDFGLKSYQLISKHLKPTLQVFSSFMQVWASLCKVFYHLRIINHCPRVSRLYNNFDINWKAVCISFHVCAKLRTFVQVSAILCKSLQVKDQSILVIIILCNVNAKQC